MKSEFKEEQIQCPQCEWQPDGQPYWACDNCGHLWDTFDTCAVCPKCKHRHDDTQCPHCLKVSPHVDWYVFLQGMIEELLEEAFVTI
ncbi:MAG: hypothetical protein U0Y10_03290 [Spirosomataceae bacterium]